MIFLLNTPVSILGVLLAAGAYIAIGMIWYHPKVLGSIWLKLVNKKLEDLKSSPSDYILATIAALLMATALAIFIGYGMMGVSISALFSQFSIINAEITSIFTISSEPIIVAIAVAIIAWIGFVIPSAFNEVIWEGRNRKLFMFNMAQLLVSLVVMAVVYIVVAGGLDNVANPLSSL